MGLSGNRGENDEKRRENRARSQIITLRHGLRSHRVSTEVSNWLKTRAFRASGRRDSSVQNYLSTYLGPIGIRIEPLSNGALATFPEGQVGIFQGRVPETGLIFATGNAKIYISTVEKLVLSAESADGVTSPIAVASDDRPD